jgi:hypothetical protein
MHLRTLRRPLRAWGPEIRRRAAGPIAGTICTSFGIQALLAGSGIMVFRLLGVEDRGNLAFLALVTAILAQAGGLPRLQRISWPIGNTMRGRFSAPCFDRPSDLPQSGSQFSSS